MPSCTVCKKEGHNKRTCYLEKKTTPVSAPPNVEAETDVKVSLPINVNVSVEMNVETHNHIETQPILDKFVPVWYRIPEIPFEVYVDTLRETYKVLEKKNKSKSSPDVFLKTILASHSGMTVDQWDVAEKRRLYEKALSMKLGDFHEEIMGKFAGRKTLPTGHWSGTDVSTLDEMEFMEVKNRDNTMNANSAKTVINNLKRLHEKGKKTFIVFINSTKKKLPRFMAPLYVDVMNGQQGYAYLSGRESFRDDLLETVRETFVRFKTYDSLQEFAQSVST